MKSITFLLCAGLVVAAGWLNAAEARHGKGHGKDLGQIRRELNLTDEQKQQLEALRAEFQKQHQELRAQVQAGTLSREEARAQIQAAAESHKAALDAIFTPQQRQQLEQARQNHPGGPGKGMGRGRGAGGPGPGRMAEALGLSEEQKAQWQELARQHREQMQELRQSGQRPDPQTLRQLRQEHQQAFFALLTPEQLQKWEELKKNGKGRSFLLPEEGSAPEPASKPVPKEESWGEIKSQE